MEANKKRLFWLDLLFFLLLLAVGFYFFWKSAPQATAPDNGSVVTSTSEVGTDLPEGVTVEDLGDGNKLVKNEKDDYSIKVTKDEYVYKNPEGTLRIQDYEEPAETYVGFPPGCEVNIDIKNDQNKKELEKYFFDMCEYLKPDCEKYKLTDIKFNEKNWIKVELFGGFVGSGLTSYHIDKNDKMYSLYFKCTDKKFIDTTLSNFSF